MVPELTGCMLPPPIPVSRWIKMRNTYVFIRAGGAKPSEEHLWNCNTLPVYLNLTMKIYICRYVRASELSCGVKRGRCRGAGVSRQPDKHTQVCLCSSRDMQGKDPSGWKMSPHAMELMCFYLVFSMLFIFFFTLKNAQFCFVWFGLIWQEGKCRWRQ